MKIEKICLQKTCKLMFIETLFIIAPKWKYTKLPSTSEWINTLVDPYNGSLLR